jgi:hypothetical protein
VTSEHDPENWIPVSEQIMLRFKVAQFNFKVAQFNVVELR